MNKFKSILIVFFFLCSCNGDLDLGMRYQKILLAQKGNESIYCYSLTWALDAEAYFISSNKDVCLGFDTTKDYCFGQGSQLIYYKFEKDTLNLYCYGSSPTIPIKNSSIKVVVTNLKFLNLLNGYEEKFRKKKIQKVILDSFHNVPCKTVEFPINFKKNSI